jgi:hypothetical protein
MTDALEHLRHIRVLEAQVENNKDVVAALREIEENLIVRIDDSTGETAALVETALTRIGELREAVHRLERKIDALAISAARRKAGHNSHRPRRIGLPPCHARHSGEHGGTSRQI